MALSQGIHTLVLATDAMQLFTDMFGVEYKVGLYCNATGADLVYYIDGTQYYAERARPEMDIEKTLNEIFEEGLRDYISTSDVIASVERRLALRDKYTAFRKAHGMGV